MKRLSILLLIAGVAAGCSNAPQLMPGVSGKAGEVIVVVERRAWEGVLGNALRDALAQDFAVLPQSEPMYNLVNVPPIGFTAIFESHRNIIHVRIVPEQSEARMDVHRDMYAAPQLIVVLSGASLEHIAALVRSNGARLAELFDQAERQRVMMNTKKYPEPAVHNAVVEKFGGAPFFPVGFNVWKTSDRFIWIQYESQPAIQGVLVFSYPYTGESDMSLPALIAATNRVLQREVPSSAEGSYMRISPAVEPHEKFLLYNNHHFVELRGLWEIENGYMGGPFVSHTFFDKSRENLCVLLAFVYAPGKDKRNFMRQCEALLYTFEWADATQ